jgi:hypothetical protein
VQWRTSNCRETTVHNCCGLASVLGAVGIPCFGKHFRLLA